MALERSAGGTCGPRRGVEIKALRFARRGERPAFQDVMGSRTRKNSGMLNMKCRQKNTRIWSPHTSMLEGVLELKIQPHSEMFRGSLCEWAWLPCLDTTIKTVLLSSLKVTFQHFSKPPSLVCYTAERSTLAAHRAKHRLDASTRLLRNIQFLCEGLFSHDYGMENKSNGSRVSCTRAVCLI